MTGAPAKQTLDEAQFKNERQCRAIGGAMQSNANGGEDEAGIMIAATSIQRLHVEQVLEICILGTITLPISFQLWC